MKLYPVLLKEWMKNCSNLLNLILHQHPKDRVKYFYQILMTSHLLCSQSIFYSIHSIEYEIEGFVKI